MGVCYLMEYFIMTKKQKKFLEKTFKCLNINAEQLMEITKIGSIIEENKLLKERVEFLEKALTANNEAVIKINAQATKLAEEVTNMQNEAIWGGKLDG